MRPSESLTDLANSATVAMACLTFATAIINVKLVGHMKTQCDVQRAAYEAQIKASDSQDNRDTQSRITETYMLLCSEALKHPSLWKELHYPGLKTEDQAAKVIFSLLDLNALNHEYQLTKNKPERAEAFKCTVDALLKHGNRDSIKVLKTYFREVENPGFDKEFVRIILDAIK